MSTPARALIGVGTVRHRRLRPVEHAFAYPVQFLLLPLRSLRERPEPALRRNRRGALSFHDADHGDGGPDCLAWMERLLAGEGIDDADGEVWLHCFPRVLGRTFKPVSFWYCHRRDGSLAAVVVEVNNTFGERHCYLLDGPTLGWGRELRARKVFHVSPFCQVEGSYRFRFLRTDLTDPPPPSTPAPTASRRAAPRGAPRTVVRVDHDDDAGPLLLTSVSGELTPLTRQSARRAFWRMPAMGLSILARIHWHALRLWHLKVPWFTKPDPPVHATSR